MPVDTDIATQLLDAFRKHQLGRLAEAESIYREILVADPKHLDAWQLLGALLIQNDRPAEAIPCIRNAIAIREDVPQYHVNLGTAYSRIKNLTGAVDCYREAIRLQPNNFDALKNLGSVLIKLRRFTDALEPLRYAVALKPNNCDARLVLGVALLRVKQIQDSMQHFEFILSQTPDHRQALAGLGEALLHSRKPDERAVECWQKLQKMDPENPGIYNNLATILKNLKRLPEAKAACEKALELRPGYFPALCNLGMALSGEGRFEEARECLERAARCAPGDASEIPTEDTLNPQSYALDADTSLKYAGVCHCQLAAVHNILGDIPSAHRAIDKALAIDPEDPDSHMMRGFLHLECGEYEQGWPDYEWRKRSTQPMRKIPGPDWHGEPIPGGTVLLHAEQGLGDTIHFVRYAKLVRQRASRVLLLSHRPLVRLMQSCPYVDEVIPDGDRLPPYDAQVALLSLPSVFGTTLDTIPAEIPYIFADPDLVEIWRERLSGIKGLRVGISWQGNREFAFDQFRSMPLHYFKRLAEVPGVRLISLQKADGTDQLANIDFEVIQFSDLDATGGAFMDTAAIMKNIDVVISPDSATNHLAGALGVTAWLANSYASEWRWLRERSDSPWYPTVRIFRQTKIGDWDSVFDQMRNALQPMAARAADVAEAKQNIPPAEAPSRDEPIASEAVSPHSDAEPGQATESTGPLAVVISPGELLDKITILQIKLERMTDPAKLELVRYEHDQLDQTCQQCVRMTPELEQLIGELKQVNERLWEIEDAIRECEREQLFDARFIELARSVYFTNDRRSEVKKQINLLLRSAIVEQKSYTDYGKKED